MDVNKIKIFIQAVESGSLLAAAEKLGYTQAGLTHIMKALERQLVDILGEEGLIELGLDTKEIEKSVKEIVDEIPKWINN